MLAFNYITSYAYNGTLAPVQNTSYMLQLSLRTLGPDPLHWLANTKIALVQSINRADTWIVYLRGLF